jgi:spermidine synthase
VRTSNRVTRIATPPVARVELLRDLDRPTGQVLLVDGVEQSYVDDDPTHLEFEYMQHMALVLDIVRPGPVAVRAVHLGAGAMTMVRWLAATRPTSTQTAVESAEDVLEIVQTLAPVECAVIVDDAVHALDALPAAEADVVIWDLYDGPRAATSALTLEAIQAMRRLLDDQGLLLLNVSDATPFEIVRPVLAALGTCFDDVVMLAEPSTLRGRRSGNCVLVGSVGGPLPQRALARAGAAAPVRATLLAGDDLQAFIGDTKPATIAAPLPRPDRSRGRAFL